VAVKVRQAAADKLRIDEVEKDDEGRSLADMFRKSDNGKSPHARTSASK
jgi:hypothetical protein